MWFEESNKGRTKRIDLDLKFYDLNLSLPRCKKSRATGEEDNLVIIVIFC